MARVKIFLAEDADLFHLGRTLVGLYSLPNAKVSVHLVRWMKNPVCAALESDGLKLAIELSDHSDFWDQALLDWCDVYAKRNLDINGTLPARRKTIPYGLNWACHSRRSAAAVLKAIAITAPMSVVSRWRAIYRYLATPDWKAFERRPDQPVEQAILFQTRVWTPEEAPGDEVVNEQRASLLRALKREFGDRVRGGIVPTPFALQHYGDLVTAGPSRQSHYIRWARKPLIGIYSRGLFGSIAFKMAEFLAASKCIVSEPVTNELDSPLDHLLVYRSEEECLAACESLLNDKSLADFHRHKSWNYYQRHIKPEAHMSDLLSRALAVHQGKA